MATDKDNPQIMNNTEDKSKFNDERELEKYGVWIKIPPEEIEDIDFKPIDMDEGSIITKNEENMGDNLEQEFSKDYDEIEKSHTNFIDTSENEPKLENIELDKDSSLDTAEFIPPIDDNILDDSYIDDLDIDLLLEEDSEQLMPTNNENTDILETEMIDISNQNNEPFDLNEELDKNIEKIHAVDMKNETEISESLSELETDFDETDKIIEDLTEFDNFEEYELKPSIELDANNLDSTIKSKNNNSEILKKIEQELLSIKNELKDVKKELSIIRPNSPEVRTPQKSSLSGKELGFFEEDEDETIALTGDELDNILNAADIIEEAGLEFPEKKITPDSSIEKSDPIDSLVDSDLNADILDDHIIRDDLDTEIQISETTENLNLDIYDTDETTEPNYEIGNITDPSIEIAKPGSTSSSDMPPPEIQDKDLLEFPPQLKIEIKSVLSYMDHLLESLPREKIDEFTNSEHYEVYKKIFEELGLN